MPIIWIRKKSKRVQRIRHPRPADIYQWRHWIRRLAVHRLWIHTRWMAFLADVGPGMEDLIRSDRPGAKPPGCWTERDQYNAFKRYLDILAFTDPDLPTPSHPPTRTEPQARRGR